MSEEIQLHKNYITMLVDKGSAEMLQSLIFSIQAHELSFEKWIQINCDRSALICTKIAWRVVRKGND